MSILYALEPKDVVTNQLDDFALLISHELFSPDKHSSVWPEAAKWWERNGREEGYMTFYRPDWQSIMKGKRVFDTLSR